MEAAHESQPNGHAEVITSLQPVEQTSDLLAFPFDLKEVPVEVPAADGDEQYIVSHVFVKLTGKAPGNRRRDAYFQLLAEREQSIKRSHEKAGQGRARARYSEDRANAVLYDKLIGRVFVLDADRNPVGEMTAEEARELPFEQKSAAIQRLYQSHVELERRKDSDRLAFLRGRQQYRVVQLIGEKKNPSFAPLRYVLNRPTDAQRLTYQEEINQLTFSTEEKDAPMETTVNLEAAVTLFDQTFDSVENGTVGGEAFTPERRADFLVHIDPEYKLQIVAEVMNSFTVQRRD